LDHTLGGDKSKHEEEK